MTVKEAHAIRHHYDDIPSPSEEDDFLYTEAMDFLIREENNPEDMLHLGGWYYGKRKFDLALKYYEMASAFDIDDADVCLGYIWYYGRTGKPDYEKAFQHYSKSMKRGNPVSTYKVADMYHNGYYVEKDEVKYRQIIEDLYKKVKKPRMLFDPYPEVATRLARIRRDQGKMDEAADLFLRAKNFLAKRIRYSGFFGNLNIMKWLIDDLYEIIEFDPEGMDLFDLYYVLKRPAEVSFFYKDQSEKIESMMEDGSCVIHFQDKWYRDRDEFFQKARIGNQKLTAIQKDLWGFEAVMIDGDH